MHPRSGSDLKTIPMEQLAYSTTALRHRLQVSYGKFSATRVTIKQIAKPDRAVWVCCGADCP
jgi:hypothetical protein